MSLKTFYAAEADIPENLRGAYIAKNGRYELDDLSDDHPTIETKKSLERTQATLKRQKEEAEAAKAEAERDRDEYKANPTIPRGKRLVDAADVELLEAAKAEGFTKESFAELKAKADKAETLEAEKLNEKVSEAAGKDKSAWFDHAKANGLKFETRRETVDGKEQEYFVVVNADNSETKLTDYVAANASHVKDAETKQGENNGGFSWSGIPESGQQQKTFNPVDAKLAKYSPPPSAAIKQN